MPKHVIAALAALAALTAAAPASAGDVRIRRQCEASGEGDVSMSARYEKRGERRKFSAEFEAAAGGRFAEGDRIGIRVDGVAVGAVALDAVVGGDLVGDLNFDTRRQADADPFPSTWPSGVGRGTKVEITRKGAKVLACTLR